MNKLHFTSEKLEKMSAQGVFDTVASHLLTQNEPSTLGENTCQYLYKKEDHTILMCAAGCLIDLRDYDPEIEGNSWEQITRTGLVTNTHSQLIQELQLIHDTCCPHLWLFQLQNLAIDHGFERSVLEASRK